MSQIQLLTSKISHICQEICDIKSKKKPQSNIEIQNYTNTGLDEGLTNRNYTRELDSSNSAKEGNDGGDGLGETYSSHSKLCHHESNNPNNSTCHAPIPPSPNPPPSGSILEPPGNLSPSNFQNRDINSLFAHVMGEEGLQCCPLFFGPYKSIQSLRRCQEIGLVTFMFFFELLLSYVSLQFSSMFFSLTYFQSFFSLFADYPRHPRRRRSKI